MSSCKGGKSLKNICAFICIISGVLLFSRYLFADKLYLKNGRTMEGIVEKEDDNFVTLNLGFGRIKLSRDEIDHIERYDTDEQRELESKWKLKYFTRTEYAPPGLKDLVDEFNQLLVFRNKATSARRRIENLNRKIKAIDDKLEDLNKKLLNVNKKISSSRSTESIQEYNKLIVENNSLVAQIKVLNEERKRMVDERSSLEGDISRYIEKIAVFRQRLDGREEIFTTTDGEEREFCKKLREELSKLDEEFDYHRIGYTPKGGGILVSTVLNDTVEVPLLVDTGAGVVVVSPYVAQRLGVPFKKSKLRVKVTLADGSVVEAYPFYLDSVSVGSARVSRVRAAVILDSKSLQGVEGLLGMSFLEHFRVVIDGKANKLILTEFNP